jgi:hypothetical protein
MFVIIYKIPWRLITGDTIHIFTDIKPHFFNKTSLLFTQWKQIFLTQSIQLFLENISRVDSTSVLSLFVIILNYQRDVLQNTLIIHVLKKCPLYKATTKPTVIPDPKPVDCNIHLQFQSFKIYLNVIIICIPMFSKCIFFEVLETILFRYISFLLWVLQYFKGVHYRDICLFYSSADDILKSGVLMIHFYITQSLMYMPHKCLLALKYSDKNLYFLISHSLSYVFYGEAKSINWK